MGVTDSRSSVRISPTGKRSSFKELLEELPSREKDELWFVVEAEEGTDLDFAALLDEGGAQADWCRAFFRSASLCRASLFLRRER